MENFTKYGAVINIKLKSFSNDIVKIAKLKQFIKELTGKDPIIKIVNRNTNV